MLDRNAFAGLVHAVAQRQDRTAFAELFDFFAPRIKAYLLRLGASEAVAEELTQDVMLTLWRKAALFNPEKSTLSTWLFRVARNRRIDALRRDRSGDIDTADPFFQPEDVDPVDVTYDTRRRDARVRVAMAALPEQQRILIRLAFFDGLSHSQIAEKAGLPLGTVKSRIRLGFNRLRKLLEADDRVDTD